MIYKRKNPTYVPPTEAQKFGNSQMTRCFLHTNVTRCIWAKMERNPAPKELSERRGRYCDYESNVMVARQRPQSKRRGSARSST